MSLRRGFCIGILAAGSGIAAQGHAAGFTGLGYLSASSHATDVSAGGVAVGTSDGQAFRWTGGSGLIGLGAGTGGPYARVVVSADGAVVAGSQGGGIFRWTSATGAVGISGATDCDQVGSIHSEGSALSGINATVAPFNHHCRWTAATGMDYVGGLPEVGQNTVRTMLNVDATALTWASYAGGPKPTGFLSTTGGGTLQLCDPDTGPACIPQCMTQDAAVVAGMLDQHAFRWTAATGVVDLGELPAYPGLALPRSLREDGARLVGLAGPADNRQAMVWDAGHGLRRIVDLMTSYGIALPPGWTLRDATALRGGYIVGDGDHAGHVEAWRIALPSPFALLGRVQWLLLQVPPKAVSFKARWMLLGWVGAARWLVWQADAAKDPKTQAALRMQARGLLQEALDRLDGCARSGTVDGANGKLAVDWILTCNGQAPVYAPLADALVDIAPNL